jgi:hypothetical protein
MIKWKHTVYFSDLSNGTGLKFADRAAIAQRFRESSWFRHVEATGYNDLADYLTELEEVEDIESFAMVMTAIYDEADYGHACYIDTVSPMPGAVPA